MDQPDVMMGEPPKKNREWLKWTLIGCGGLLVLGAIVLGIAGYYIAKNTTMSMDPAEVETMAQEILQFEKPADYRGVMGGGAFGAKMAVLAVSGTEDPFQHGGIFLMSLPVAMSEAQAEEQFSEAMRRQGGPAGQEQVKERLPSETFKARGEDVTAQVGASGGDGKPRVLHYTMTLKNAAGETVFLMLGGPEEKMTHAWVQEFLDTVR